ncbi:four helix bundle protein [Saccharicrinis sp. FJH62]|uniref:four helix bundle protein n=1 Tax=Saccharicrinis sp. FJH62 TaxID=3344657 RepID=UPI0035D51BAC
MDNKEFSKILEERTKSFAVRILKFSSALPGSVEGRVLKNQLSKSGTSIGANYREANRARSRADFSSRIKISESEASETVYWLEVIKDFGNGTEGLDELAVEAKELLAIFSSISKKL